MMYPDALIAMRFDADPGAGRAARAFVGEHLDALGMSARAEDVELVVTELVTNAVLHARTGVEVRLAALPDGLRVEVGDGSPTLPTPGTLDRTALSGRGLMLLQSVVERWGAEPVPGDGKTVWCELTSAPAGEPAPLDVDTLLAIWDDEPAPVASAPSDPDLIEVTVPPLAVRPLLAAKSHMEDLLRELQLILMCHADPATTPAEVVPYVDLARRLDGAAVRFAEGRRQIRQQALSAAARGLDEVTVHLRLPREVALAAEDYLRAVEDAQRLGQESTQLLAAQGEMQTHADIRRCYLTAVTEEVHRSRRTGTPEGARCQ